MIRRFRTVAILALAGLAGCGGAEEDNYTLVKVTGTVTKNGKPLADATVTFVPEVGNKNSTPAVDLTGTEGNYMVKFKGRTGVAPGKYKVMITPPVELPAGAKVSDEFIKDHPGMLWAEQEARNGNKKKTSEAKREAAKSEFPAEVGEQAVNVTLDFDVKS